MTTFARHLKKKAKRYVPPILSDFANDVTSHDAGKSGQVNREANNPAGRQW
jgi:hypothetical protein